MSGGRTWRIAGWAAAGALLLGIHMRLLARADPTMLRATLHVGGWSGRPRRIVLLTDLHAAWPDMPPERVARLVGRVNALRPDLVLIGGDLIGGGFGVRPVPTAALIGALRALRAPLGRFAVLGNHDHWSGADATREALASAGIAVLDNAAARAGPFAIGGVDDDYTGHARLDTTLAALLKRGGLPILLSHSPDPFVAAPPWLTLTLAGHTHCGQVRVPGLPPPFTAARTWAGRVCGIARAGGRTLIVSAGVGTSLLPLRLGAHPDLWVVEVGR